MDFNGKLSQSSGVLSPSALSISSVYLGHDGELHWFNESRAHNCLFETCISVCVCVRAGFSFYKQRVSTLKVLH